MVELLERDQLLNQLEALSADDGRLVFVGGEAGVGKTSLVRAFAAGRPAPSLFGQEFDEIKADNRYGIPASWALHAWIWKPNPSGMLYAWNPRVDCSDGKRTRIRLPVEALFTSSRSAQRRHRPIASCSRSRYDPVET